MYFLLNCTLAARFFLQHSQELVHRLRLLNAELFQDFTYDVSRCGVGADNHIHGLGVLPKGRHVDLNLGPNHGLVSVYETGIGHIIAMIGDRAD